MIRVAHPASTQARIVFSLQEAWSGSAVREPLRDLRVSQFAPPEERDAVRLAKLQRLIRHAYDHTEFYRRRMDDAGVSPEAIRSFADLERLPVLTKADILRGLDQLLATNIGPSERHRSASGGSTGEHTPFYRDNRSRNAKTAAQYRFYEWAGWSPGEKLAIVWPAIQDFAPVGWKSRVRSAVLDRRLFLESGRLDDAILSSHARALASFQPRLLRAMPNPLFLVTRYLRDHTQFRVRPAGVLSTGEPLLPHQRALFETTYDCPVFDCYASREVGHVAAECEAHDGMHWNAESLHLEFQNTAGRAAQPGELGRILVTDFENVAMPFIRYDIGDMGIPLDVPCSCGRTLPRMAMGAARTSDFITAPDGAHIPGIALCHYILAEGPDVGQIQIVQDEPDHLTVRVRRSPASGTADLNVAHAASVLDTIFKGRMRVSFEPVDVIEREPSGKYRFSINRLAGASGNGGEAPR